MRKFCQVYQPLAYALEFLQGEIFCFLGYLLPTLVQLKRLKYLKRSFRFSIPLVDALLKGIDKKFEGLNFREVLIAAVSHPYFKLKWIEDPIVINKIRTQTVTQMLNMSDAESHSEVSAVKSAPIAEDTKGNLNVDDFFCFQSCV